MFKEALLGRLDITFKAQEVAAHGEMALFETLLKEAVGSTVSERFEYAGPSVELGGTAILPVSMILHELATNAMKYGALTEPEGIVRVTWEIKEEPDRRARLVCQWCEEGGPLVSQPERRGYGTELIEGLAAHLGGSAELYYVPTGLSATFKIPM